MAKYLTIHVPENEPLYPNWAGKSYDDFEEMLEDLCKQGAMRLWEGIYTADRLKRDLVALQDHFINRGFIYEEFEIE